MFMYLLLYSLLGCWCLDTKHLFLEVVTMPKKVANLSEGKWLTHIRHNFIIEGDPGCPDCGLWDGKTADESKMVVALADCIKQMVTNPNPLLNLRWCLIGDDDTYFALSNIVPLLRKYDPEAPWFLGFGCGGTWVKNKYRLVCRVDSPSRGFLYGYANADIAYGGKGMMISVGALRALGAEGVARCRRELVCGNMDGRVAHCLYNNGTGVQLTDISALESVYGILTLHRRDPHELYRLELARKLNASEAFCFARTKQPLHYKSGAMLLGLPSPWFTNMQETMTRFVIDNDLKLFHPLDIDLPNSKFSLLPLEHIKPFHLARLDVYVDFPFDYASLDIPRIESQLDTWQKHTVYNSQSLHGHPGYIPLTQNETVEREELLKEVGYKGKVGPLLPWTSYMQIIRAQVAILPLEDPVLRVVRSFYQEHVDLLLQRKFELPFPPTINEALTNGTLLTFWRRLYGLTPANAQYGMYGGLTQSIADLSLPGRQLNPVFHPFWFETKIPHPPHKHQIELEMGINVGVTFAELIPVDLAHYDECMVLLEVILGWHNLPNFKVPSATDAMYESYLAKVTPQNLELLKKMNTVDASLYHRAQKFLQVLRASYQHSSEVLQQIVKERKKIQDLVQTQTHSIVSEPHKQQELASSSNVIRRKPGFIFSQECRATFALPAYQYTRTREHNGVLVEGPKGKVRPIKRLGTKEDSWIQIPRGDEFWSNPFHREKVAFQRPSKYTTERHSPVTGTVLISDRYRFIYIAVYKAASRTLLDLVFRPEIEARYVSSYDLTPDQKTYFTFSFVREPLSRFVSGYKTLVHRMQIEEQDLVENTTHTESGIPVTFHKVDREPDRLHAFVQQTIARDDGGVLVVGMQHMFTQAYFFSSTDAKGEPTLARGHGVLGLDFLGRVEDLDKDWEQLEILLKLPPVPKPIEVRNKEDGAFLAPNETSFHLPVTRSDLTTDEIKVICNFYRQDFICFGYRLPKECLDSETSVSTQIAVSEPLVSSSRHPTDRQPLDASNDSLGWVPQFRRSPVHKSSSSDSVGIAWFGLGFLFVVAFGLVMFLRRKRKLPDPRTKS